MSVISGTVGAILGSKSQKDANDKQLEATQNTNAQNLRMFRESRGSTGSAVLPLYLKNRAGQLFEKQLGLDLTTAYDQAAPKSIDEYKAALGATDGARQAALGQVRGLFDGTLESEALDRFTPVRQARVAFSRQAAIEGLNKTLAEIDAANAGRGFSSDSMGERMLRLQANRGAAGENARAELANLEEERAIRDNYARLALENSSLPYDLAQKELQYFQLPEQAYLDAVMNRMEPLNFLKLGAGAPFRAEAPNTGPAVPSAWQLLAQSSAKAGNMALNYWLNSKMGNTTPTQTSVDGGMTVAPVVPVAGGGLWNANPQPNWT